MHLQGDKLVSRFVTLQVSASRSVPDQCRHRRLLRALGFRKRRGEETAETAERTAEREQRRAVTATQHRKIREPVR